MTDERRINIGLPERALPQLKCALTDYAQHPEIQTFRDSVVMRYVFMYELCVQLIRRFVHSNIPVDVVDLNDVDADFYRRIEPDFLLLQAGQDEVDLNVA